jgi:hypothetical protein
MHVFCHISALHSFRYIRIALDVPFCKSQRWSEKVHLCCFQLSHGTWGKRHLFKVYLVTQGSRLATRRSTIEGMLTGYWDETGTTRMSTCYLLCFGKESAIPGLFDTTQIYDTKTGRNYIERQFKKKL